MPDVRFGYKLMSEEHGPRDLVRNAVAAEESGFAFAAISDHYHPWLDSQGHSPLAWSVLGAIAQATERLGLMTAVTCPFMRYHPAIIAQAAATIALLSGGRFTLGLGAGERLNEHVVGRGWPPVDVRHEQLAEAVEVIRLLWQGGMRSYRGRHVRLEDACVFDLPDPLPPLVQAVSGPASLSLARSSADGIIAVDPDADLVSGFRVERGGPCYAEVPLCWAETEKEAVETAWERFRFGIPGWKVMAELPNPVNFEAATATIRREDVAAAMACGPDPEPHVQVLGRFLEAGFDHVILVGIGPDQDGFLRFWRDELRPRLEGG